MCFPFRFFLSLVLNFFNPIIGSRFSLLRIRSFYFYLRNLILGYKIERLTVFRVKIIQKNDIIRHLLTLKSKIAMSRDVKSKRNGVTAFFPVAVDRSDIIAKLNAR